MDDHREFVRLREFDVHVALLNEVRADVKRLPATFAESLNREIAPLAQRIGEQNGRIGKVEEWQKDRTKIERVGIWAIRSLWIGAGGSVFALLSWAIGHLR